MKKTLVVLMIFGLLISCVSTDVTRDTEYMKLFNQLVQIVDKELLGDKLILMYDCYTFMGAYADPRQDYDQFGRHIPYSEHFQKNFVSKYRPLIEEHNNRIHAAQAANAKPQSDLEFLLESSLHAINFDKRSNEQLMTFLFEASVALAPLENNVKVNKNTYDKFKNLLLHYDKASEVLFNRGVMSKEQYNDFRIKSLQYDAYLKNALYR
jgi:hypothetical protein